LKVFAAKDAKPGKRRLAVSGGIFPFVKAQRHWLQVSHIVGEFARFAIRIMAGCAFSTLIVLVSAFLTQRRKDAKTQGNARQCDL
jgi:hypothetical protein